MKKKAERRSMLDAVRKPADLPDSAKAFLSGSKMSTAEVPVDPNEEKPAATPGVVEDANLEVAVAEKIETQDERPEVSPVAEEPTPKKKRGRKPGTKNRPKSDTGGSLPEFSSKGWFAIENLYREEPRISINHRIPESIKNGLHRANYERSTRNEMPTKKQDIILLVLHEWLAENGYLDTE